MGLRIVPLRMPSTVSESPSLAKDPPTTATVALASFRLSGSLTEAAGAIVTGGPFWVTLALFGTFDRVGGSLTLVTLIVVVTTVPRLFDRPPSLRTQGTGGGGAG